MKLIIPRLDAKKLLAVLFIFFFSSLLNAQILTCPDSTQKVSDPTVCFEEKADVVVESTQLDVNYYLINLQGDTLDGPKAGLLGLPITFTVQINNSDVLYVLAKNTLNGCIAVLDDSADVTVIPIPSITDTTQDQRCGSGILHLAATASTGNVQWFDALTGGTLLATASTYTTPALSTTTTYYVQANNSGCVSTPRIPVVARVVSEPQVTSVVPGATCGPGTVVLSATPDGGIIRWFDDPSGGSLLQTGTSYTTTTISATTTFYVAAIDSGCTSSPRTPITASVVSVPTLTTTGSSQCGQGTATLTATSSAGTINWYDAATNGNNVGTGNTFTVTVNANTSYYAEAINNGCTSESRESALAIVTPVPTLTANPVSLCSAGTATLTASASNGLIKWYDASSGGNLLHTGSTYTVVANANATFYVGADDNGCLSASRVSVPVSVGALPTLTVTSTSICGPGVASLTAVSSAGVVKWYSASSGGTSLYTGTTYTVNASSSTTLYAEADDNGCLSADREAGVITVNSIPSLTTTPVSHCGAGTFTMTATPSVGASVTWYDALTNGNVVSSAATFTIVVPSSTTFYAEATANGCTSSPRNNVPVTIYAVPTVTASPVSRCGAGTVTLTAIPSAGSVKWYDAITNGNQVSATATFTTSVLASTTFYVEATANGCTSDPRVAVPVTINSVPTLTANPVSNCGPATVTLTATPSAGASIKWYNVLTGGTSISTQNSFTVAASSSTTYYAEALTASCTSSPRTAVAVTIDPIPTVSASSVSRCGPGTLTLTATATSGSTVNWFDALTGGSQVTSGTSFTTSINSTEVFYAEADLNGCVSASRATVNATINPIPTLTATPVSRCGAGTVTLTATPSAGTVKWYDAASNGNQVSATATFTMSVPTSTTYYAEVTHNGCTPASRTAVPVTIKEVPTLTTTPVSQCGQGTVTLTAVPSAGSTVRWYDVLSGGSALTTGNAYTVSISSSANYFADAELNGCFSSPRNSIAVTVTAIPTLTTTPVSRCGSGTVTLMATPSGGATVSWFDVPIGGSSVGTGNTYTVSVSTTTTYYASASINGCTSDPRNSVLVTVNSIPTLTTTNVSTCGPGTVTLTAVPSSGATVTWFDALTGGNTLYSGAVYTPSVSATSNFFASASVNGCTSSPRNTITVTVNSIPTITGNPASVCGPGPVPVTISASSSGNTINWYDASSGGTLLTTAASYNTPGLYVTTTYYAAATNTSTGCVSSRIPVVATVNDPRFLSPLGDSRCDPGSLTLTATANAGSTITWYDQQTGGNVLATGGSYTTPHLTSTTIYFVEASIGSCKTGRLSAPAIIGEVTINSVYADSRCDSGPATFSVSASSGSLVSWFTTPTGGTAFTTGTTYTTTITSNTTYYVEASKGSCSTSSRTPVTATVTATPSVSSTTGDTRCGSGVVQLSAAASAGTLSWYSTNSGGSPLASGTTYTTTVSASTTFYVAASIGNCVSSRSPVVATVNAIPVVTASSAPRCGPGPVILSANSSAGTPKWYANIGDINPVSTGNNYSVNVASTTTFYVDATSSNGCTSTRIAITATVNPVATLTVTGGSRCGAGTVVLTAFSPDGTLNWYATSSDFNVLATGTSYTTTSLSTTTTYYVDATSVEGCPSLRQSVVATINAIPTLTTSPGSRCGTGTVVLSATASSGTPKWYLTSTDPTEVATSTTYTTPTIGATTTFYVAVTGTNGCSVSKTGVVATVNAVPTLTTTSTPRCGPGTVVLSATSSSGTPKWYVNISDVTPVATSTSYITPTLSTSTTYYVETTGTNGCISAREPVVAIVSPIPSVTAYSAARCGTGTVVLTASSTAGVINWYVNISTSVPLATGSTYTTSSLSNTATYYVEADNNGCLSGRTAVTATVNSVPSAPTFTAGSRCDAGTVVLKAATSGGNTLDWYNSPTGGTYLFSGTSVTTPTISSTTTFYVEAVSPEGCSSSRKAVVATVFPTPSVTSTTPGARCDAGTVNLSAVASSGSLNWYSTSTGGTSLGTGSPFTTPSISATTTYFVDATSNGCTSATRISVTAVVNNSAVIFTQPFNTNGCSNSIVTFSVVAGGTSLDYQWQVDKGSGYSNVANGGPYSGAKSPNLSIDVSAPMNGYKYRCIVNSSCSPATSSGATLTINSTTTISSQPTSVTLCSGNNASFVVNASGGSLEYQWQVKNGSSYQNIADNSTYQGSSTYSLSITNLNTSLSGSKYRCYLSSKVCGTSVYSDSANLIVNTVSIANAGADQSICSTTASLSAASISVGTGKWKLLSGAGTISTPNNTNTALSALGTGQNKFSWTVTNLNCISADTVNIVVSAPVTVANAGADQTICSSLTNLSANTPVSGIGQWSMGLDSAMIGDVYDPLTSISGLGIGNHVFVWTIKNGTCVSSDAVIVEVNLPPSKSNAGSDQNICTKTTKLHGNKPSSGTGQWSVVTGSGVLANPLDSLSSVSQLSVGKNKIVWTIKNKACTSVDTVVINVTAAPTVANAGQDQTVCTSFAQLNANVATTGIGQWTKLAGSGTIDDENDNKSGISNLSTGTSIFVWTINTSICNSSDTVSIEVVAPPSKSNAGVDQSLCTNMVVLHGNKPVYGTGKWTQILGTGTIKNEKDSLTSVSSLSVGKNSFVWVINSGSCTSTDTVDVFVPSQFVSANAGADQTICTSTTKLDANKPQVGSGKWTVISGGATITDVLDSTSQVVSLSLGQNIFVWTVTGASCSVSDTVIVDYLATPTTANAGNDQIVCTSSALLTGNKPTIGKGKWTVVSGTATFVKDTIFNTTVSGLSVGPNILRWTISNGNCSSSFDEVTITLLPTTLIANAGVDVTICTDTISLSANTVSGANGTWSQVNGSALIQQSGNPKTSVSGLKIGTNIFVWTLVSSCGFDKDTVEITRLAPPSFADAGSDQEVCGDTTVVMANAPLVGKGVWSIVSGTGTIGKSDMNQTSITGLLVGNVVLRWTISNGNCPVSSDDVTISKLSSQDSKCLDESVTIPNGFSPDGDGVNDQLVIEGIEQYPGAVLKIFNRWGDLVYEKIDYRNDWDGTSNVKGVLIDGKLPAGTYFMYVDFNNGRKTKATFLVIKY